MSGTVFSVKVDDGVRSSGGDCTMATGPATRPSLLMRLRDLGDREAWETFVALYAPLVYGFACKYGLQDADAADLTQEVLCSVTGAARRLEYDPSRGSFRGWLYRVTANRFRDQLRARRLHCVGSGDSAVQAALEQHAAPDETAWEEEFRQRTFVIASERVRRDVDESSWQSFWRIAVEAQKPKDVAAALAMSIGAVYVAKSRVLARLREEVAIMLED
jgi:RNA polymerase sigma-70 factor (ECF subfamily)